MPFIEVIVRLWPHSNLLSICTVACGCMWLLCTSIYGWAKLKYSVHIKYILDFKCWEQHQQKKKNISIMFWYSWHRNDNILGITKIWYVNIIRYIVYKWYIRASLVVQLVKNLPAMQDTSVLFLGWEEVLATHYSILAWRIPMDRGAWQATVHRVTRSRAQLSD